MGSSRKKGAQSSSGSGSGGSDMAFPLKLHQLLKDAEQDGKSHIVSWMASGKAFKVYERDAFSSEILPRYFRHSNFKSFQRNLSTYQFNRVWSGPEKGGYTHEFFDRLYPEKSLQIVRRGVEPLVLPSTELSSAILRAATAGTGDSNSRPKKRARINKSNDMGETLLPPLSLKPLPDEGFARNSSASKSKTINFGTAGDLASSLSHQDDNILIEETNTDTVSWMIRHGISPSSLQVQPLMPGGRDSQSCPPVTSFSNEVVSLFGRSSGGSSSMSSTGHKEQHQTRRQGSNSGGSSAILDPTLLAAMMEPRPMEEESKSTSSEAIPVAHRNSSRNFSQQHRLHGKRPSLGLGGMASRHESMSSLLEAAAASNLKLQDHSNDLDDFELFRSSSGGDDADGLEPLDMDDEAPSENIDQKNSPSTET